MTSYVECLKFGHSCAVEEERPINGPMDSEMLKDRVGIGQQRVEINETLVVVESGKEDSQSSKV